MHGLDSLQVHAHPHGKGRMRPCFPEDAITMVDCKMPLGGGEERNRCFQDKNEFIREKHWPDHVTLGPPPQRPATFYLLGEVIVKSCNGLRVTPPHAGLRS